MVISITRIHYTCMSIKHCVSAGSHAFMKGSGYTRGSRVDLIMCYGLYCLLLNVNGSGVCLECVLSGKEYVCMCVMVNVVSKVCVCVMVNVVSKVCVCVMVNVVSKVCVCVMVNVVSKVCVCEGEY